MNPHKYIHVNSLNVYLNTPQANANVTTANSHRDFFEAFNGYINDRVESYHTMVTLYLLDTQVLRAIDDVASSKIERTSCFPVLFLLHPK
jgi:hypothetical protein